MCVYVCVCVCMYECGELNREIERKYKNDNWEDSLFLNYEREWERNGKGKRKKVPTHAISESYVRMFV